jgi:HAMP domain-containing protein
VQGVAGTWKDLTDNVNQLAGNLTVQLRDVSGVATAIAARRPDAQDHRGRAREILQIKDVINTMVGPAQRLRGRGDPRRARGGHRGRLGGQAKVAGVAARWDLTDNVNSSPATSPCSCATYRRGHGDRRGDLTRKITWRRGEILRSKEVINAMVDRLSVFADEVTRVAREVGTEGVLGGQAEVPGVAGTWKDLTDSVNFMASNLTNQVRNIADVTTAVARGDLSQKITVDVKGEMLQLKNTVNTMVDQLSSFASEVTRVAREVGTEGGAGRPGRGAGSGRHVEGPDGQRELHGEQPHQPGAEHRRRDHRRGQRRPVAKDHGDA